MANQEYQFWFKGDDLINLYRIEGVLESKSPLHIGTGEVRYDDETANDLLDREKPPEIAAIERDFQGLPMVTGSALRGVIRHYLLNIFRSFGSRIAKDPDYDKDEKFRDMNQIDAIEYMKNKENAEVKASLLAHLFAKAKLSFGMLL